MLHSAVCLTCGVIIVFWLTSVIESSQVYLYIFLLKKESKVCLCMELWLVEFPVTLVLAQQGFLFQYQTGFWNPPWVFEYSSQSQFSKHSFHFQVNDRITSQYSGISLLCSVSQQIFIEHLVYAPGTLLGAEDRAVNKTVSPLQMFLEGEKRVIYVYLFSIAVQ